ncbi:DUF4397 family protein [Halanaeroarchaeum sp. HSR-CO]|uniref:DUF4397 domain-containing protein n=1 Tax=Halanaeroarchaeum sp. HSR-CO TaxID=2866382 RepID=UPI00217D847C|nr:DUF4397 domain-containing protein [Halanaeroarchaeum sp. HSR-CO]UWG48045.1 DUF4397 family protein [Halanaeroarchaeum sp. HSR-CO]
MTETSRKLLVVALSLALVGSIMAVGAIAGGTADSDDSDADPQQTSYLRAVHASPDAPAVDVMVENETVLENVSFGDVSEYLPVEAGTYNVTIAAAEDPDTVVFDGNVTLEPRTVTTLAATGEISDGAETSFEPVAFEDTAVTPGANDSAVRVVHLSPDAPTVDITAGDGSVVLAENVSYQNASDYATVPAGNYTVEIRAATADNDGDIVTTVDVSLENGTAYSAMAVGYLNPDEAPADTMFEVLTAEDATKTIVVPTDEEDSEDEMTTESES